MGGSRYVPRLGEGRKRCAGGAWTVGGLIYSKGEGGRGKRLAEGAGGGGVNSGNCARLQCTRFCKQHVRVGRR